LPAAGLKKARSEHDGVRPAENKHRGERVNAVTKFFTSVKLAIVLLIIIIVASVLGTLIPQDRGPQEYAARYGQLSGVMIRLQLTHLYHSFWYMALLLLFGANILVCSLIRLSPKLKKSMKPVVMFEAASLMALKTSSRFKKTGSVDDWRAAFRHELRSRRYKVREETSKTRTCLLARKGTLGWFGSDVVHLGLLIILAGGFISGAAGFRDYLQLREGQIMPAPRSAFAVRLDKFEIEFYPQGSPKAYKSTVTVVEGGRDVLTRVVQVNHPLSYKGLNFYQSSYGSDLTNPEVELWVTKKSAPAYIEKRKLHPGEKTGLPDGLELRVEHFVPDFIIGQDRQVESRSDQLNNPAAQVVLAKGSESLFGGWVFANYPDFSGMHSSGQADFSVQLKSVQAPQYSVLEAAKDPGANVIWLGCILLMAGLFLAFYWPTREIKVVLEGSQGKTDIAAGGLTSKSRETFEAEFQEILAALRRNT
jgi:cytochrome c biogenesis protein